MKQNFKKKCNGKKRIYLTPREGSVKT